jgi:hypothetical protein
VELARLLHCGAVDDSGGGQRSLHGERVWSVRVFHQPDEVSRGRRRFYIDVAAWSYIGLVVVLFLVFKLAFLMLAWRHPEKYLRFKGVI